MKRVFAAQTSVLSCLLPCIAQSSAPPPVSQPSPTFLYRDGTQLLLEGKPFRTVGVNKRELLDQYVADLLGGDLESARGEARRTLDRLADMGVDVIRVCGCQFWPVQMSATFKAEATTQAVAWQRFDQMLDDCAKRRIRLVVSIGFYLGLWSDLAHESLHEFMADPRSRSRRMHDAWVAQLVARYRDNPAILFWELPNELNLYADLAPHSPGGLFTNNPDVTPGPVVRDGRNHLTSDEAAAYMRETAALIKSIDPNHLVGSGLSLPRSCAWHLRQGSRNKTQRMDWTQDTAEQQAEYVRLMAPDPVDLVCVHHYFRPDRPAEVDRLVNVIRAGRRMGKPVYVGESGADADVYKGEVYSQRAPRAMLREYLTALRQLDVPVTLLWAVDEYGAVRHEPVIWSERQPETIIILREAQAAARRDRERQRHLSESQMEAIASGLKNGLSRTATRPGE